MGRLEYRGRPGKLALLFYALNSMNPEQESFLAEEDREAENLRRWAAAEEGKMTVKPDGSMVMKLPHMTYRQASKAYRSR